MTLEGSGTCLYIYVGIISRQSMYSKDFLLFHKKLGKLDTYNRYKHTDTSELRALQLNNKTNQNNMGT